jgi:hypothetical protein
MNSFNLDFLIPFIQLFSILFIPVGALLLLYGYKLFKIFLAIFGFIFGFIIGVSIGAMSDQAILIGLLSGALCSLLFYALYKIGIFLLGAFAGALVASLLMIPAGEFSPAFFLFLAVAGGISALFIENFIIILASSYQGASIVIAGFAWLLYPGYQSRVFLNTINHFEAYLGNALVQFLPIIILTIVGMLYQYNKIPRRVDNYLPDVLKKRFSDDEESMEKPIAELQPANIEGSEIPAVRDTNTLRDSSEWGKNMNNESPEKEDEWVSRGNRNKFENESIYSTPSKFSSSFKNQKPKEASSPQKKNVHTAFNKSKESHTERFPFHLKVMVPNHSNKIFYLTSLNKGQYRSATIGRASTSASNHTVITVNDRSISRKHAEFAEKNGSYYVRNLSETNPLYLNNRQVSKTVFEPIKNGDIVRMGQTHFMLVYQ